MYAQIETDVNSQLVEFSRTVSGIPLDYPEGHPWHFFEIAATYLVRAFMTEGLDQLLWHMVALEALEGGEPVRRSLKDRLAALLATTTADRKTIRKRLTELYDLRCDLVHGNRLVSSLPAADLADLRRLVRPSMLWFARWLAATRDVLQAQRDSDLPNRAQLLSVLNLDEQERRQLGDLLRTLPAGFPNVPGWRD